MDTKFITMLPSQITLMVGECYYHPLAIADQTFYFPRYIIWSSSCPEVVSVKESNVRMQAKRPGTAIV